MMNYKINIVLFLLVSFISSNAFSQNNENDVIQLSGIVLADTSHVPIQLASVMVKNTRRGTNTDFLGFFSLVVRKKEHIQVSALGYKKASITIPDTLTSSRYGVYVRMIRDTVMLKETVVFPWPSVEQFKKVFVELQVPPDEYDIAKKNLAVANMKNIILGYNMDAYSNYNSYIQKQTDKLYYAGQIQPNNLLNPFAWGAFFKAIGNGDFSNKNK